MAGEEEQQNDDSMEEILHSIRDIVSGEGEEENAESEESVEMAEEEKAAEEVTEAGEEDILELTDVAETEAAEEATEMTGEETPQASTEDVAATEEASAEEAINTEEANNEESDNTPTEEASGDVLEDIDEALDSQEQPAAEEATTSGDVNTNEAPTTAEDAENLISNEAAENATSAMKGLLDNIPKPEINSPEFRNGNTVEDLVVETLKPMLSEWLSENLPVIVRQIVEKEVKKLIPRE